MSSLTPHEWQKQITHRIQLTIPVTVIVEVAADNYIAAQLAAAQYVGNKLRADEPKNQYYPWNKEFLEHSEVASINFKNLVLRAVPEPEPEA